MSAHTPGPWRFQPANAKVNPWDDEDMGGIYAGDTAPVHVCDFGDGTQYYPTEGTPPSIEDGRLMAAAPELLEALSEMTELAAGPVGGVSVEAKRAILVKARAAIAKATGAAA